MSAQLAEALKELALQPGERRSVTVDGEQFEIRRVDSAIVDEGPMITLDFKPPLPVNSYTVIVPISAPLPMRPIIITEDDLAPDSIANLNIEIGPFRFD